MDYRPLGTTGLSVTEVALACGFTAASHFSRVFRASFGVAPSNARAWRRDQITLPIAPVESTA